jgi:hypothetical protein
MMLEAATIEGRGVVCRYCLAFDVKLEKTSLRVCVVCSKEVKHEKKCAISGCPGRVTRLANHI